MNVLFNLALFILNAALLRECVVKRDLIMKFVSVKFICEMNKFMAF